MYVKPIAFCMVGSKRSRLMTTSQKKSLNVRLSNPNLSNLLETAIGTESPSRSLGGTQRKYKISMPSGSSLENELLLQPELRALER